MSVHGATDVMQKFNPIPPGPVTGASGASASGGMPEGDEFAAAERAAAEELAKFVTDVQSGFTAYTDIVQSSATDYLRGDGAGADAVSQAQQEIPMFLGES
ncbi:hypothetical protein LZ318_12960 [Saccharopolyspora indica]|uniref:hypothetical protein n=1 Tax=Saccharopolyspora indica TaxID=1229659 RepID=UPI0022EAC3D4|nr:hypothetical protein [Saccharopolyspora indica]MDA3647195.1 hypothetical protein [Saccharopolyspora indica]